MVKWPFSRKQKQTDSLVPSEVQEYYQAERRERVGTAWLLAAVTLVATILIALGFFYGGRWAYRTLFTDDNNQTETQLEQDSDNDDQPARIEGNDDANTSDTQTPPAELPGDTTDESSDSDEDELVMPRQTPRTGPRSLPSTGPSSNL